MIVLVAAGTAGLAYTLPVTLAIVVLLAVLVISYRQVIDAFPGGGGAYAVASTIWAGGEPDRRRVADRGLRAQRRRRRSAGVEALTSAFPDLYSATVSLCLGVLALITAANLWGVAESARLFIGPMLASSWRSPPSSSAGWSAAIRRSPRSHTCRRPRRRWACCLYCGRSRPAARR